MRRLIVGILSGNAMFFALGTVCSAIQGNRSWFKSAVTAGIAYGLYVFVDYWDPDDDQEG